MLFLSILLQTVKFASTDISTRRSLHYLEKFTLLKGLNYHVDLNRECILFMCHAVKYEQCRHKTRRKMLYNFTISPLHNTWFSHSHLSIQDVDLNTYIITF